MGKNTTVMPQKAPLSIFSLGKGRESLHLKPYEKLFTSVLSDFPTQHTMIRQGINDAHQNCPKYVYFSREFCTFPVTEGNEIQHIYFQFTTPERKLTHNTKFEHFWIQKDTNFGDTIFIRHFRPENPQTQLRKT